MNVSLNDWKMQNINLIPFPVPQSSAVNWFIWRGTSSEFSMEKQGKDQEFKI